MLLTDRALGVVKEKRERISRVVDATKRIPVVGFASEDYHVLLLDDGTMLAIWETEGLDSSCLSETEIQDHHELGTVALNEMDPRICIHQYFLKDRAAYQSKKGHYRDGVINAIDQAREVFLKDKDYFSTRILYALEFKSSFVAKNDRMTLVRAMLADGVKGLWNKDARVAFGRRLALLRGEKAALNVGEKQLLQELDEFRLAGESLIVKVEKIMLASSINPAVTEGIGPAKVAFDKVTGMDAFRFLARLWNWDPEALEALESLDCLPTPMYLAPAIAKEQLDFGHRSFVYSGRAPLRLFTVRKLRDNLEEDQLRHIRNVSAPMLIHTRFAKMDIDASSALLQSRINKASHLGGFVKGDPLKKKRMEELEVAKEESVRGRPFGDYSCTVVIGGGTEDEVIDSCRQLERVCSGIGVTLRREEMSKDQTFYSLMPGNHLYEYVTLKGQSAMAAALFMPYRMPEGWASKPPKRSIFPEPLCNLNAYTLEQKTLFPVNFWVNVEDLAHFSIIGQSGGGKSFLTNFFLTNWGRYQGTQEHPKGLKRWIIDKGDSYRSLSDLMKGAYVDVASDKGPIMNPFDQPPEVLRVRAGQLAGLCTTLITAGSAGSEVSHQDIRALERAVIEMADDIAMTQRKHGSLALLADPHLNSNPNLKQALSPWLPGGPYAHIFPEGPDGFVGSDFVVYNFNAEKVPEAVIGPVFFYLMMKIQGVVESSEFKGWNKLLFIDEAAFFFTPKSKQDVQSGRITAELRSFYRVGIKNWRKFGGAIGVATQEPSDFTFDPEFWETFRGGVPTKIYIKQDVTTALTDSTTGLGIPIHLAEALKTLDKGVFLVDQRGMRRFLQLLVDPVSYAVYTTDPIEGDFRARWLKAHPFGPDYTEFEAFQDIGKHIATAGRSSNAVEYLQQVKF